MIWVKPLDTELLKKVALTHDHLVTVEDGTVTGGFGSAIVDWLRENRMETAVTQLGVKDEWVAHGSVDLLKNLCGYDSKGISEAVRNYKNLGES